MQFLLISICFLFAMVTTAQNPCNRPVVNAQLVPVGTLSIARANIAVAAAGNKIVFAGGINEGEGSSAVDIYDVVTHSWSIATLSVARWGIAATSAGNKIFFAGGYNTDESTFSDVYPNIDVYDVTTNTWSVMLLSEAKSGIAAAALGNKVYFAGGGKGGFQTSDKVEIYDITTNTWTVDTLSEARTWMAATLIGKEIFFAGGDHNGYGNFSNKIDIYNTSTNSWSVDYMAEHKAGMAGLSVGSKNFWAGGFNGAICSQVEIRDESTHNSVFTQLCYPRLTFDAVVKDNKIVFFTGIPCSNGASVYNRFEIYDITTDTWSIGTLPVDILGASIISYNNTIYAAGGAVNGVYSDKVYKLEMNTVLPLNLLNISAETLQQNIVVYWQTAHEINTAHFIVERSADGRNFSSIGSVTPRGNASATNDYSFTDQQPLPATNFYRLKMVDPDGGFIYSKVVAVKMYSRNTLQIFPNPAHDILFVQVNGINENASLQITDAIGRKLKEEKVTLNGSTSFSVDIKDLPKGMYHILLLSSSAMQMEKFVKQ